ncbi:MAG: hypothetical protein J7M05_08530 [Anaerolineae bacterium]|nr:hypothetical protein [Anaerolineae bacterium]
MILWLVLLPLLIALLLWPLGRFRPLAAPLTVAALWGMALLSALVPQEEGFILLGRSLALTPEEGLSLAVCYGLLGFVVLATFRLAESVPSYSLLLAAAASLAVATSLRSFTLAVLTLTIGGILLVFLLPWRELRSTLVGTRVLFLLILSMVSLLLAAWVMENPPSGVEESELARRAGLGLALGFGLALGLAPLGMWLLAVFRRGGVLAGVAFQTLWCTAVLLKFSAVLQAFPWPEGKPWLLHILLGSALFSLLLGGVGALLQRSLWGVLAYAALADLGMVLLALEGASSQMAMWHLLWRNGAVALVAIVVGILDHCLGGDTYERVAGAGRHAPLALLGLLVGGLSLSGLPPAVGFVSRLFLLQDFAKAHPGWAIVVLLSGLGVGWAFLRYFVVALLPALTAPRRREPLFAGLLALSLSVLLLGFGVAFPHLLVRLLG